MVSCAFADACRSLSPQKKKSLNEAFDALLEGDTYVEDLANNLLGSSSLALEQEMMLQIILNATFFLFFFL